MSYTFVIDISKKVKNETTPVEIQLNHVKNVISFFKFYTIHLQNDLRDF